MSNKSSHRFRTDIALALLFVLGLLFLCPTPVYAMHIAEGILPANWAAIWYVIAVNFLVIGILIVRRKTREVRGLMPLLGVAGAVIFLVSVFPVPQHCSGSAGSSYPGPISGTRRHKHLGS